MTIRSGIVICGLSLAISIQFAGADTYNVINTTDSGTGSLRQAILDSNASAGVMDTIAFNIPGTGVRTIIPLTALPAITDPVIIDGYTQPGSSANTLAIGNNSVHLIELNGNGAAFAGLTITAGNSMVNGLVINRFNGNGPANGITIQTNGGNTVKGCFIGLDPTGTTDLSNSRLGIDVESANNTIGGTTPQARNVIFDITGDPAIYMPTGNAGGNTIQGNYIATNAQGNDGLTILSNGGVYMETANNVIGGSTAGAGNLISGAGLETRGDGTIIQGNYIGISADGTSHLSNGNGGVILRASGNLVGGTTATVRNIIASGGVTISGPPATGNIIQGNYIGTNAAGTAVPIGGGGALFGVEIEGATNTLVGGTTAGARNIISNSLQGLRIFDSPSGNNMVQGNYIGTNAAGTAALPNSDSGVVIFTSGGPPSSLNTIGGTAPGAGNVISGNGGDGISVAGAFSSNNTIQGNFIGVAADGVTALGNQQGGVRIAANVTGNNNVIGGTAAGAGNVIAFNGVTGSLDAGVRIESGTGNSILGNSISSNLVLGINLANNDNVTPNDPCDADTGPNNLQNYPVLTSLSSSGGNTSISGSLNSTANTTFRIEFFSSAACDPLGNGQGQTFLGFATVTTNGTCTANINATLPVAVGGGAVVTATATDPNGNTSEFSGCVQVAGAPTPTPTPTPTPIPSQLLNISTRMRVDTGNNVLIGGFIVTGNAPKNVAVRGIGPSLAQFGIPGVLADPTLELRAANGSLIVADDDWQDDPAQAAQLTALALAPSDPKESGIVATLQPASYTAILAGKNQTTGIGLVEVYDTNQAADSQLANISTRGFVLTGSNVMIGGFILGGNSNTGVVVRGIGPSLAQFGLSPVLADPTLELHDSNGAILVSNDDWQDDPVSASQITALGLAPSDIKESGIFRSLPPGSFTAILAGKNGGTGIGLVEVYNVH